jgi:hypothetical protein
MGAKRENEKNQIIQEAAGNPDGSDAACVIAHDNCDGIGVAGDKARRGGSPSRARAIPRDSGGCGSAGILA